MIDFNLFNHCFVEYEEYSFDEFKEIIPVELFHRGICVKEDNKLIFKCTGFIIINNLVFVIFPKGYVIPNEDQVLKKHVLLLIDVLIKYSRQKNKLEPDEESLLGGIGDSRNVIAAAFWLIRDYFENGIIDFHLEEYGINQSNSINWARTIKSTTPLISNRRPVYLELITKRNIRFANIITQIHQYVIDQCLSVYGWLFGYNVALDNNYDLPCDKDLAIHLLDLEAQQTFEERKLNLFLNLKEFIIGSHTQSKDSILTFVTPYFHSVWEKICYFIFTDNTSNIPKLPKPYWKVNGIYAETEQIPDVMFRVGKVLFILDAKYYRVKFAPRKLPGWGDLVKQFYYRHTLMDNDNYDAIENIFIFPGYTAEKIEYLGYAGVAGKPSWGKIRGYVLDIYKAMDCYVNNNKCNFKEKLINLIEVRENL